MKDSFLEQRLFNWLPGLRLLFAYDLSCWRNDLTAGLVVALVLIPSAIAYADLAKCPPISGFMRHSEGWLSFRS